MKDLRRILIIRTDRLGETLLTLPAVHVLHRRWPQATITFMAAPQLIDLLKLDPTINSVLPFSGHITPLVLHAVILGLALRRQQFDAAIILNSHKLFHLATWLAGIPVRVGFNRKWPYFLTHRITDERDLGELHEVMHNMHLLSLLEIPVEEPPDVTLAVPQPVREEMMQMLEQDDNCVKPSLIAVHIGASVKAKQWLPERFRELIVHLMKQYSVVVIGSQEFSQTANSLCKNISPAPRNFVGKLTLLQLAALLQRCTVLISSDSGPVHLAASLATPTVVLFGTTEARRAPQRWQPWGKGHSIIHRPSMGEISTNEVLQAAQRYLEDNACIQL